MDNQQPSPILINLKVGCRSQTKMAVGKFPFSLIRKRVCL